MDYLSWAARMMEHKSAIGSVCPIYQLVRFCVQAELCEPNRTQCCTATGLPELPFRDQWDSELGDQRLTKGSKGEIAYVVCKRQDRAIPYVHKTRHAATVADVAALHALAAFQRTFIATSQEEGVGPVHPEQPFELHEACSQGTMRHRMN